MSYAFKHHDKGFLPEGGTIPASDTEQNNRDTEAREIDWLKTGPDKVFLYVKPQPSAQVTTWLGTPVATDVVLGSRADTGFGFRTYRRAISCRIFGTLYHGWYMESSGDYCRLKKAKRQ